MRLNIRLPQVEPNVCKIPEACPYRCGSQDYQRHSVKGERKTLRDTEHDEVAPVIRARGHDEMNLSKFPIGCGYLL